MRVLVAFDKFKDSLPAEEACAVAAATLSAMHPAWEIDVCPLADGGDGFTAILTNAADGSFHAANVTGPRGETVTARFGIVDAGKITLPARQRLGLDTRGTNSPRIAIVDMAGASGLALLPKDARNPWTCSSRGTGELLLAAAGCRPDVIVLGIGGSATHDLGVGALQALGFGFKRGSITPTDTLVPDRWGGVTSIEEKPPRDFPTILIACDVDNPLLGETGAAACFAPQKGLPAGDLERIESETRRMAALLCDHFGKPFTSVEAAGAGAAGGFAFGLMTALGARLVSGAGLVFDWLDLPRRIAAADLIITGEGRFDVDSLRGKGPGALVKASMRAGKLVQVFAGRSSIEPTNFRVHQITPPDTPEENALSNTRTNLAAAIRRSF